MMTTRGLICSMTSFHPRVHLESHHASELYIDSAMAQKSELFCNAEARDLQVVSSHEDTQSTRDLLEITIVLSSILIAVWTPQGKVNAIFNIVAASCVV